jgi:undecaprenyl phosphate N,N'-diacetylbacillosamine 1-phosphate transferase
MYKFFFKRLLDIFVSISVLLLASPIFFIILILLLIVNQGKPFFMQERPGIDEKLFKIIKFKTMNDKKDHNGNLLSDADRV